MVNKNDSDLVISASPEFLLRPICEALGIKKLISSIVNKNTGKYLGENCYGEEKVFQFKKQFVNVPINKFYSDSLSDEPISRLAYKRYIVDGNMIIEWDKYKPRIVKRITTIFLNKQFLNFLVIGCINTLNGIIFSYIFSIVFNVNVAFIIGYITSMMISYILNSLFVFKEKLRIVRYAKFFIAYIPNFIIQNIFVMIFYNMLGMNKLLVFALSAVIGVPITFIIMKVFAFNKKLTSE